MAAAKVRGDMLTEALMSTRALFAGLDGGVGDSIRLCFRLELDGGGTKGAEGSGN